MTESTQIVEAVIGAYADYLHFHFSLNEEGKLVPDYSLGEFILPPGVTAKQMAVNLFGSLVSPDDFAGSK